MSPFKIASSGHFKLRVQKNSTGLPTYISYDTYTDQNLHIWSYVLLKQLEIFDKNAVNLAYYDDKDRYTESGTLKIHPTKGKPSVFGPFKKGYSVEILTHNHSQSRKVSFNLKNFNERVETFLKKVKQRELSENENTKPIDGYSVCSCGNSDDDTIDESSSGDFTSEKSLAADETDICSKECKNLERISFLEQELKEVRKAQHETDEVLKQYSEDIHTLKEENFAYDDRLKKLEETETVTDCQKSPESASKSSEHLVSPPAEGDASSLNNTKTPESSGDFVVVNDQNYLPQKPFLGLRLKYDEIVNLGQLIADDAENLHLSQG